MLTRFADSIAALIQESAVSGTCNLDNLDNLDAKKWPPWLKPFGLKHVAMLSYHSVTALAPSMPETHGVRMSLQCECL